MTAGRRTALRPLYPGGPGEQVMIMAVGDIQAAGHQIGSGASLPSDTLQLALFPAGGTEAENCADGSGQREPEGLHPLVRQIADIIRLTFHCLGDVLIA